MGIDELRIELAAATDDALEKAGELAVEVMESARKTPRAFQLAREFQAKRTHVRALRREIKAEVAG